MFPPAPPGVYRAQRTYGASVGSGRLDGTRPAVTRASPEPGDPAAGQRGRTNQQYRRASASIAAARRSAVSGLSRSRRIARSARSRRAPRDARRVGAVCTRPRRGAVPSRVDETTYARRAGALATRRACSKRLGGVGEGLGDRRVVRGGQGLAARGLLARQLRGGSGCVVERPKRLIASIGPPSKSGSGASQTAGGAPGCSRRGSRAPALDDNDEAASPQPRRVLLAVRPPHPPACSAERLPADPGRRVELEPPLALVEEHRTDLDRGHRSVSSSRTPSALRVLLRFLHRLVICR